MISQVALTATAAEILTNTGAQTLLVTLRNAGANPATIGNGSGVTFGAGFSLAVSDTVEIRVAPGRSLYGICDTALTATIELIQHV